MDEAIVAAGAILALLKRHRASESAAHHSIQRIDRDDHLWMDKFTIRNLELLGNGTEWQSMPAESTRQHHFANGCKTVETLDRSCR